MTQIENNTVYDKELLDDASKVLTGKYKKIVIGEIVLLALLGVYLTLVLGVKHGLTTLIIIVIGIILILILGITRISNYKKTLFKRLKVVNNTDTLNCKFTIDSEKTVADMNNGSNTLFHNNIKKITETSMQYVVVYEGSVFILVAKSGFENNDEDSFKKLMASYF